MRGGEMRPLVQKSLEITLDTKESCLRLCSSQIWKKRLEIPLQSIYPSRLSSSFHPFSLVPARSIAFSFALTAMSASIKAGLSSTRSTRQGSPRRRPLQRLPGRRRSFPNHRSRKRQHRQPPRHGLTARKGHPRRGTASHWLLHHE